MASTNEERIDALKRVVTESFPTLPTPAAECVALHECDECRVIRAAFADRTWDSLQPHELEARFDSLPMLSPTAFKYYLPAYLLYSLEHLDPDCLVCQFTIYAIAPDEDAKEAKFVEWWRERLPRFTPEQFEVLMTFLDLVRRHESFDGFIPSLKHAEERLQRYYADCQRT